MNNVSKVNNCKQMYFFVVPHILVRFQYSVVTKESMKKLERQKPDETHFSSLYSSPKTSKMRSHTSEYQFTQLKFLEKSSVLKSALKRISYREEEADIYQMKVMTSMLPDEIILYQDEKKIRNYEAAILIADATGFTDLSGLYQIKGKGGASMLSTVLNKYLGTMVQEILSQGGDVLKFSGDALMVMFKSGPNVSMKDAIHKAIDTAITIQQSCGHYKTDIGVILRIKISISAGDLSFKVIETENFGHYIIVGNPIWDCKSLETIAQPGDILIAQTAWRYVPASEYIFQPGEVSVSIPCYYKVTGFSDSWRFIQRHYDDNLVDLASLDTKLKNNKSSDSVLIDEINEKYNQEAIFQGDLLQAKLFLRPSMNTIKEKAIKSYLIRFMIPTLRQSILANELMEHLNEMRQAVIVFVNLVSDTQDRTKILEICDTAFKQIYGISNFYEGTLNKVSLFDKDIMFLIIFGLRGFKVNQTYLLA